MRAAFSDGFPYLGDILSQVNVAGKKRRWN